MTLAVKFKFAYALHTYPIHFHASLTSPKPSPTFPHTGAGASTGNTAARVSESGGAMGSLGTLMGQQQAQLAPPLDLLPEDDPQAVHMRMKRALSLPNPFSSNYGQGAAGVWGSSFGWGAGGCTVLRRNQMTLRVNVPVTSHTLLPPPQAS